MRTRLTFEPVLLESLEPFPRVFEAIEALPPVGARIIGSTAVVAVTAAIVVRLASRPFVFFDVERFEIDMRRIDGRKVTHRLLDSLRSSRSAPARLSSEREHMSSRSTLAGASAPRENTPRMTGDMHRRQYVRVEVSLPVEFSLEGEAAPHDGAVFDLGAGGMRLVASYDLPPRSNVSLKFRLPAADRGILARGRVVLSFFQRNEQKFHHGIAFTSLDPRDRSLIAEFVDHQEARRTN